jgi:hypothetical protein
MAPNARDPLGDIRAALQAKASTRSPLHQWLLRNHDQLAEMFEEAPPRWGEITAILTNAGFTAVNGEPLKPQAVRQTWHRVKTTKVKKTRHKTILSPREESDPVTVLPQSDPADHKPPSSKDALGYLLDDIDSRSGRKPHGKA